jgi:signal transduction histidine kinase
MSTDLLQILLVEDNPGDARLLHIMLREEGAYPCELTHVERCDVALQQLAKESYGLVLLDLSLPDSHGFATFDTIYAHSPHIPIIVLSGLDDESLALRAMREGAQDYLVKGQVTSLLLARAIRYSIERKRIEEALRIERASLAQRVEERTVELASAVTQLQRAAHLRNEFLAKVSHELRTPLSIVLMNVDLIQKGIYGPVSTLQHSTLDRVRGGGKQLLHLIDELLNVAEIESGRLELQLSQVSAQAICQACVQRVQVTVAAKQIHLTVDLDASEVKFVGDEQRMGQVLYNLLDNAVKFTPEGGTVGLSMEGNRDESTVLFSVWDNGIGIAKKDQERIFEPFVQLEETLTRQHAGAGLGLAVVKDVVNLHGGRIVVESEPGIGSWFTIVLPWREDLPLL